MVSGKIILMVILVCQLIVPFRVLAQKPLGEGEARAIAREAYLYANPIVDSYRVLHEQFVNEESANFIAPWNQLANIARVYTHKDTTVQTPNSDTPYSWLGLDLRTEPIVLTVPPIDSDRYFSIQLIDLYTHNFDYIGSRTTGNDGGHYLIAGPGWHGDVPETIARVFHAETELAVAIYRTQLYGPGDLENVKAIQAGYKAQNLSAYLGLSPPQAAPQINYLTPLTRDEIRTSPKVFEQLNFLLQFCPLHPSEKALMERFARLGIGRGKQFDFSSLPPETQEAIGKGIADAWMDFEELKSRTERGEVGSADVFGTREHLQNNYLYRMAAAVLGIWGNSAEEATYPSYFSDSQGERLDGANRYTMYFAPGLLPPVHSFWSLTMYQLPASLLVENSINRYLLNSNMVEDFVRDADGGITLLIQHSSPGKEIEANWLPAPTGPFSLAMRLYWPKEQALDGTWQQPPLNRLD